MVSAERVQITLTGGAPWGFRLSGGGGMPLTINKIRKKSQAHERGLQEGDAIISINGVHVHDKTQDEALELVEGAGDSLTLEIYRGDIDELGRDKPKKFIPVQSGSTSGRTLRLMTTADDGISPGEVVLIPSGHNVTSDTLGMTNIGTARVVVRESEPADTKSRVIPVVRAESSGRQVPVKQITTAGTAAVDRSPVISVDVGRRDVQQAVSQPILSATPFTDTQGPSINGIRGSSPRYSPQPPPVSPKPQRRAQPPPPAPRLSPQPPALIVSHKPQTISSSQPPPVRLEPPGMTSSTTFSTFDDGQTRWEVTREQRVQQSGDGNTTTVMQRETATTAGRPHFVKSQSTAFNSVVQPSDAPQKTQRSYKTTTTTTTTTLKSNNIINQKGPTPFSSSFSPNVQQQQILTASTTANRPPSLVSTEPPMFKPTRFVPGSGTKEVPGLYTPTSPLPDVSSFGGGRGGKENMSPQPMFQVKNIVSDKVRSSGPEVWRPNMWLPGQQPASQRDGPPPAAAREDFPSYSPVPGSRPGYSLVEEQKKKLLASQISRNDYDDDVDRQQQQHDSHGHHKHERLHIFAPPVEIHADSGYQDDHYHDYYDDDGPSSPDSFGLQKKKKLYSDSAFYDTPGKNYPTINEQMKLCKIIAQSLTSAANRRARGAKMFMKRKRKSSKWVHEGHSEFSSSAGDVANLHELESELSPEDGGNKPLLYFKIPSLKHRIGNEAKQTKMALSQEEFEKLRLSSKKCDHKALPPDACFDIVADLKAHKGRGGKMFERRKERSDKFIIDESNAKFKLPAARPDFSPQPNQHKTPWEIAMMHGAKVEPAPAPAVALPTVRSSLKSDDSPWLLKGTNFNRTARGWGGGGEYPIAENITHISAPMAPAHPARPVSMYEQPTSMYEQPAPVYEHTAPVYEQPSPIYEQQSYNDKVKAWQALGESSFSPSSAQNRHQDSRGSRRQGHPQQTRHSGRGQGWAEQTAKQAPRPKSWQPETFDSQQCGGGGEQKYATIDYRCATGGYPGVAYKQPIIPGTDL